MILARLGLALATCLMLASCTPVDYSTVGTVTAKEYRKAYSSFRTQCVGKICTPISESFPDRWSLTVSNCPVVHQENMHCRQLMVEVTKEVFDATPIGAEINLTQKK